MSAPPGPPSPSAAPSPTDDRALEALWQRCLEAWADEKAHGAFIERCRTTGRLGVAAARYRAESVVASATYRDEGHAQIAKKRLDAILALAMAEVVATRTEPETEGHATFRKALRAAVFLLFAGLVLYTVYRALVS